MLNETTPLESRPEKRDLYAQCKLRQEQLFWEYHRQKGVPLTVLRPGVIYGPRGSALSSRIGLRMPGVFLFFGGDNLLPLSYVENCAEAIVLAGRTRPATGEIYNVLDDELMSCREFFVATGARSSGCGRSRCRIRCSRPRPPWSSAITAYSRGQLPAVLTPYKVAAMLEGHDLRQSETEGARLAADGFHGGRHSPDLRRSSLAGFGGVKSRAACFAMT